MIFQWWNYNVYNIYKAKPFDMKEGKPCIQSGQLLVTRKCARWPQEGEVNWVQKLSHWVMFLLKWLWRLLNSVKLLASVFHMFWNWVSFDDKGWKLWVPSIEDFNIKVSFNDLIIFQIISLFSRLMEISVFHLSLSWFSLYSKHLSSFYKALLDFCTFYPFLEVCRGQWGLDQNKNTSDLQQDFLTTSQQASFQGDDGITTEEKGKD